MIVGVIGSEGRMGQRLIALSLEYGFSQHVAFDRAQPLHATPLADVYIDFSHPDQALPSAAFCATHRRPLVLGTTGLSPDQLAQLDAESDAFPLLRASNFSLGVHVLGQLVRQAAQKLHPASWDLEISESHHRAKIDAPSGTALTLAAQAAEARDQDLNADAIYGRHGQVGPRPEGEIGIHTLRGGTVFGEHRLDFFGPGEVLSLEHRALDRDIFARGALVAARFLAQPGRSPGRYSLDDLFA